MTLYLLGDDLPWWHDLVTMTSDADDEAVRARAALCRALVVGGWEDPWVAGADALLHGRSPAWHSTRDAPGVEEVLAHDVEALIRWTRAALEVDVRRQASGTDGAAGATDPPRLSRLAPPAEGFVAELARSLREEREPADLVADVLRVRRRTGGGPLARHRAFRWTGAELSGVTTPTRADASRLVGLERVLEPLEANTSAFLDGRPAMHVLLYGPRGSGKSTAVRGLLARHAERGLRLVELPPGALGDLPDILDRLRGRAERFLLFVDDLTFESGDAGYAPLKTLLEGSVSERPDNVRLYATSNRRHLVQERLRDRPDPLDDDVHAWDTQHERLALADRFGLLLTFPSADRRRYLEIVRGLAARDGLGAVEDLEGRADRFARHGNGYSGRTAQQFVDAVRSGLA